MSRDVWQISSSHFENPPTYRENPSDFAAKGVYPFVKKGYTPFTQKGIPLSFKRVYPFNAKGYTPFFQKGIPPSRKRVYPFDGIGLGIFEIFRGVSEKPLEVSSETLGCI